LGQAVEKFYFGGVKMKKIGLLLVVFAVSVLLSGVVFADCESDCNGPFQTCLKLCRQTTKEDSAEGSRCVNNCFHGLNGCQKRCKAKDKKSENTGDFNTGYLQVADNSVIRGGNLTAGASCIEQGLTCILNGTPCCAPYTCKGKFPNTYCQ
jgi:hypothetical protein